MIVLILFPNFVLMKTIDCKFFQTETFEEEIKKLHEQKEKLINELKRSERKKRNN